MSSNERYLRPIRGNVMGRDEHDVLNKPRCRVWNNNGIGAVLSATVPWTDSDFDTDGMTSAGLASGLVTCQTSGSYICQGHISFAAAGGAFWARLIINGSGVNVVDDQTYPASGIGIETRRSLGGIWDAQKGDTLALFYDNQSANVVNPGRYELFLSVCLISTI